MLWYWKRRCTLFYVDAHFIYRSSSLTKNKRRSLRWPYMEVPLWNQDGWLWFFLSWVFLEGMISLHQVDVWGKCKVRQTLNSSKSCRWLSTCSSWVQEKRNKSDEFICDFPNLGISQRSFWIWILMPDRIKDWKCFILVCFRFSRRKEQRVLLVFWEGNGDLS